MSKPTDTNQPDHNEEVLEMVTDTNQASEAELRDEILTEFKQVYKLAPDDYTENCTNVVMSIIRAEKLKLLAAVRERVVGEPSELDSNGRYNLKVEQRAALIKLEAEP